MGKVRSRERGKLKIRSSSEKHTTIKHSLRLGNDNGGGDAGGGGRDDKGEYPGPYDHLNEHQPHGSRQYTTWIESLVRMSFPIDQ